MDRPVKRRWEILFGRYAANPLMRGLFHAVTAATFRALESQPVTVRIRLAS